MQFLKGHIEEIPLPDDAVDVVISNCVINLAADKGQVLREAFRVLKPGGRFAVSDVVAQGELPADLRADMEAWVGCVAGALEEDEYRRLLADAGFGDVEIEVTRVYDPRELAESTGGGRRRAAAAPGRVGRLGLRPLRRQRRPPGQRLRPRPQARLRASVGSLPGWPATTRNAGPRKGAECTIQRTAEASFPRTGGTTRPHLLAKGTLTMRTRNAQVDDAGPCCDDGCCDETDCDCGCC